MKKNLIIETIIDEGLVQPSSAIVVGVSGGPDSLCLLHALNSISESLELVLYAVHVNHMLRPEADKEAENVAKFCEKHDINYELYKADCEELSRESHISLEEAGRLIRYEIFDEVANEIAENGVPRDSIFIATAHNADDQSETVLHRLLRGTGSHGLGGMQMLRGSDEGYGIIKPLLHIERKDIEAYIKTNKLRPNIDASNSENDATRNKIRNELIPYLEENFNPKVKEALRRYAELASMDDTLLNQIALGALEDNINIEEDAQKVMLNLTELRDNPPPIMSRIMNIVAEVIGIKSYLSYELMTSLLSIAYSENPSASLDLPEGLRVHRDYDTLIFGKADEDITIKPDASLRMFPQVMRRKDWTPDEDSMYAVFDFDKFSESYPGKVGELVLRTRREGDTIPLKEGNKKIQDLLVDCKVKKNARDSILMVAIDSEILWVLPSEYFSRKKDRQNGKYSQKYQITDETERVLYIEIAEDL